VKQCWSERPIQRGRLPCLAVWPGRGRQQRAPAATGGMEGSGAARAARPRGGRRAVHKGAGGAGAPSRGAGRVRTNRWGRTWGPRGGGGGRGWAGRGAGGKVGTGQANRSPARRQPPLHPPPATPHLSRHTLLVTRATATMMTEPSATVATNWKPIQGAAMGAEHAMSAVAPPGGFGGVEGVRQSERVGQLGCRLRGGRGRGRQVQADDGIRRRLCHNPPPSGRLQPAHPVGASSSSAASPAAPATCPARWRATAGATRARGG
jgi:hypothetical protein